jgi:hypothetical protein
MASIVETPVANGVHPPPALVPAEGEPGAVVNTETGEQVDAAPPPRVAKKLAGKLAEVMGVVQWVKKRGKHALGYSYATEADILDAVRQALADRSVIITPILKGHKREQHVTTQNKQTSLWTVDLNMEIEDGESGEIKLRPWVGIGEDPGDKGIYKALTGGVKYFILKQFLISTGDDPEATEGGESTHPQARQNAQSARERSDQDRRMADRVRERKAAPAQQASAPAAKPAESASTQSAAPVVHAEIVATTDANGYTYRPVLRVSVLSGDPGGDNAVYGVTVRDERAEKGEATYVTKEKPIAQAASACKKQGIPLHIDAESSVIGLMIIEFRPERQPLSKDEFEAQQAAKADKGGAK